MLRISIFLGSCLFLACANNHKISGSNSREVRINASSGLIVINEMGQYFCEVENTDILYDINKMRDTSEVKNLLNKTKSMFLVDGRSIEYYAWVLFRSDYKDAFLKVSINSCKKSLVSYVIPVFINYFQEIAENRAKRVDDCNRFLDHAFLNRTNKSLIFIAPTIESERVKYRNIRDTIPLNSSGYQAFLLHHI